MVFGEFMMNVVVHNFKKHFQKKLNGNFYQKQETAICKTTNLFYENNEKPNEFLLEKKISHNAA